MNSRVILDLKGLAGGVDVFSVQLAQGLLSRGIQSKILLTHHVRPEKYQFPWPENLPLERLNVKSTDPWPHRWRKLIRYLESQSPCIYIPNYNVHYSGISPKLPDRVIVLGIVHSDDPVHYEHVLRLGKYWNGIVAVSEAIADHVRSFPGDFASRLVTIPYGVDVPDAVPERLTSSDAPLRMIYVGCLVQRQKRIMDLPRLFEALCKKTSNVELTIIGDGPERAEVLKEFSQSAYAKKVKYLGTLPNTEVLKNLEKQDVVILTSNFEGLSISLLEAMSRGCIPVVSNVRSGVPDLIRDSYNGFTVRIGDAESFAARLEYLQQDQSLRKEMSLHAYSTVKDHFQLDRMVNQYVMLFERLEKESATKIYSRPRGPILYPAWMQLTWKDYLPAPLAIARRYGKKFLEVSRDFLLRRFSSLRNRISVNKQF